MSNSSITPSDFSVTISKSNNTLSFQLNGTNTYTGNDTLGFQIVNVEPEQTVYSSTFDPCSVSQFPEFCPLSTGNISLATNFMLSKDAVPAGYYTTNSLEAEFRFYVNDTTSGQQVACLKATLSNGVADYPKTGGQNVTTDGNQGGSSAGASYLSWSLFMYVLLLERYGSDANVSRQVRYSSTCTQQRFVRDA